MNITFKFISKLIMIIFIDLLTNFILCIELTNLFKFNSSASKNNGFLLFCQTIYQKHVLFKDQRSARSYTTLSEIIEPIF